METKNELPIHQKIYEKLDYYLLTNKIPHILFHGSSGSGKRTIVEKFLNKVVPRLADQQHQGSGLAKFFRRAKLPILAGAGISAGGYTLYQLLKAMQERAYSQPQIEEWKRQLMHSRGDFSDQEVQPESPSAQPVYKEY